MARQPPPQRSRSSTPDTWPYAATTVPDPPAVKHSHLGQICLISVPGALSPKAKYTNSFILQATRALSYPTAMSPLLRVAKSFKCVCSPCAL